jgi:hypothetical protein
MAEHVDGNSLAGPLSDLFAVDMTCASGRCLSCGDISVLARAVVYADPMGLVVRCSACDDVLMTLVQGPDRLVLDLHGLAGVQILR